MQRRQGRMRAAKVACVALPFALGCLGLRPPVPTVAAGCDTDEECVVACSPGADCCYADSLCGCDEVVHRDQAEAWQDWAQHWCRDIGPDECPVASCPAPEHQVQAVCVAGRCEARKVPGFPEG